MRIGLDYRPAILGSAGIARYVKNLARALLTVDPTLTLILVAPFFGGFRRRVAATSGHVPKAAVRAFRKVPGRFVRFLGRFGLYTAETDAGPLDLFHYTDYVRHPEARAPKVSTLFDVTYLRDRSFHPEENAAGLKETTEWLIRRARRIIAISECTRDDLVHFHGVPRERIDVTPLGVDPIFRAPADLPCLREVQRRLGLDVPYFIHVGTLEPRKNLVRLVRAFDRARTRIPETKLVIVGGTGWSMEAFKPLVDSLSSRESIHITGPLGDAETVALLKGASALAYPSLWEGFGLPPLEAMASGVPVLTSDRSSMKEVCEGAALLVDPESEAAIEEGLVRLATDRMLVEELKRKGRDRASRFTWERCAELTIACYRRAAFE